MTTNTRQWKIRIETPTDTPLGGTDLYGHQRFDNLTPAVQDKVEEWQADENSCSFKVKGFTVNLQIVAKEAPKYVKIQSGEGGVPIDFTFWIQLQPAGPYDTRMRWCCTRN